MSKRCALHFVASVVLALLIVPMARAQEEGAEHPEHDWTAEWSSGHKMETSDGAFKLKFGGRIQADFIFASQDEAFDEALGEDAFQNGFEFRRAQLFFEGTLYERIKFKVQYDFAGGDADFKDVWIGFAGRHGELRFGHFKEFMSINDITSSKYLGFLERALPVEFFSPNRNSGVGYAGSIDSLTFGLGAFYDADDFGRSLDQDRTNVTGRLAWRPFFKDSGKSLLHVGGAFTSKQFEDGGTLHFRGRGGNHFGPRPIDLGIPADDALVLQLELAGVANRFWYAAEFYTQDVSTPTDADPEEVLTVDPTLDGYYVQAGFYLTDDYRRYKKSIGAWDRQKPSNPFMRSGGGGAWEVALRYAQVDLSEGTNPGELSNVTLAVNWYVNPATRVMFNYVSTHLDGMAMEEEPAFSGTVDSFVVRLQVDF